jgi:SnoaL-like domain
MARKVGLGVALLALALGAWLVLRPRGDEAEIRAALARLASTVTVTEGDRNPVLRGRRIDRDFADLFDQDVRVTIPELPYVPSGRAELAATAADLPTVWSRAEASFGAVTIKLDDVHASATVEGTATLVTSDGRETRAVSLLLRKVDGRWRIFSVTVWPKDSVP